MDAEYNLTESAKRLGIDPKTLRKWIYDMNIDPSEGTDRRNRILTYAQLKSLADEHGRILTADDEKTRALNEANTSGLPTHNLNHLLTETRTTQSEVDNLRQRLNHLETRLQVQEKKAGKEIKELDQKILALKSLIQEHLDHH
jgi:predicted RNase H-like nuclease (RuvC/YqgF family)